MVIFVKKIAPIFDENSKNINLRIFLIIFTILFRTLRTIHNHFFEVILFERGGGNSIKKIVLKQSFLFNLVILWANFLKEKSYYENVVERKYFRTANASYKSCSAVVHSCSSQEHHTTPSSTLTRRLQSNRNNELKLDIHGGLLYARHLTGRVSSCFVLSFLYGVLHMD